MITSYALATCTTWKTQTKNHKTRDTRQEYVMDASTCHQQMMKDNDSITGSKEQQTREACTPQSEAFIKRKDTRQLGQHDTTYLCRCKKSRSPSESWSASSSRQREPQSSCLPLSSQRGPCQRGPFRQLWVSFRLWEALCIVWMGC
jgi:hypothetical protein